MYIYFLKTNKRIVLSLEKKAVAYSIELDEREIEDETLIKKVTTTFPNGSRSIEEYYQGL